VADARLGEEFLFYRSLFEIHISQSLYIDGKNAQLACKEMVKKVAGIEPCTPLFQKIP
jgi:hypothetical protein